jgi:hypothetical protein
LNESWLFGRSEEQEHNDKLFVSERLWRNEGGSNGSDLLHKLQEVVVIRS